MILDKSALATSSYLKKASTIGRHTFLMFWAASHWSDAGPETKERMEYALRLHLRSMRQRGYSSSVTGPWLNCGGSVYFGSPEAKPLLLGRDALYSSFSLLAVSLRRQARRPRCPQTLRHTDEPVPHRWD